MENLFFCGGPPKSGTTYLQKILDLHPETSCNSEDYLQMLGENFSNLHKKYNQTLKLFALRTGVEKYQLVEEKIFVKNFYNLIKDIAINRNRNTKFIGISDNHFLLNNLINISNFFSNSKTIIIFRNPIDTALSLWDHNNRLYEKEKFDEHINLNKVDGILDINKFVIHQSQLWNKKVIKIFEQIKVMPNNFLVINYESLSKNKKENIGEIFNHIGCKHDEKIISKVIEDSSIEKMRKDSLDPGFFKKGRLNFGENELDKSTIESAIDLSKEGLALTKIQK